MEAHLIVLLILAAASVLLLLALVLRIDAVLRRVSSIRKHLHDERDAGVGSQLTEAVAQLQSVAVSLDRIALRCDSLDEKLEQVVTRGPGGDEGRIAETVDALRDGFTGLREPLAEIRELMGKTNVERLRDAVNRTLFNLGYDKVAILTELSELADGSGRVQVEVTREGVKSKGYVVLSHGSVEEHKISSAYEMFP